MITFLAFILVFTVLVFVHELGHFLAARAVGVRVREFSFGFPPKIFSKKIGKTVYGINLIPIGGYVSLMGEHGEDSKSKESLVSKKPWQKALIFVAGVVMNVLLAWFVLTFFYAIGGKAIIPGMWEHKGVRNTQKVAVTEVVKGSEAEKAGIKTGDFITAINQNNVYSPEALSGIIQQSTGSVNVEYERNGTKTQVTVQPKEEVIKADEQEIKLKRIGISMEPAGEVSAPFWVAPIVAAKETIRIIKITVVEFGKFLSLAVTKGRLSEGVGGPVAIVKVTGVAASMGFAALAQLVIMLSISLAVLNILPFPALDGGHLLFLGIEKVIDREIPNNIKETINKAGFVLLLILIAWITFKDLGRFGILK